MIVLECLFLTIALCDAAEPWQLGSQDAATPMMQGIMDLHHDIFFFLILILVFVLRILVRALWHFHYQKNPIPQRIVHGTTIEILWTIFPSLIPMFIAIPSFSLLYSMDEVVVDPAITIKAIGHQWYRTYEYSDYNSSDEESLTFDSYMIPEDDLELGQLRLLEVDNRVVVPAKTHLRFLVTSADVLHSWAVPSLGVKCDAVPGRLNQISIFVQFSFFLEFLIQAGGSLQELIVAYCDPGDTKSSDSLAEEVRAAALPEEAEVLAAALPDSPEEAPASPEVEIEVESPSPDFTPRFPTELPLMGDATRLEELRERFRVNTLGAPYNPRTFVEVLARQMQIEESIETALAEDGFAPLSIFLRRDQIREIAFYHHRFPLPLAIYNRDLEEIELHGTRGSQPYQRILRAIDTLELSLWRRRQ